MRGNNDSMGVKLTPDSDESRYQILLIRVSDLWLMISLKNFLT